MTLPAPLDDLYSALPKLVLIGADQATAEAMARDAPFAVVRVPADGPLRAVAAGAEVPLNAPLAGPVVLAAPSAEDAAARAALALWQDSGLPAPELVALEGAEAPLRIAHAFLRVATAATREIAGEAVSLDAQIAALRDEVEDARNRWRDAEHALAGVSGGLPVLAYEAQALGEEQDTGGPPLRQELPCPARYCRAFSVHVARPRLGSGELECRLLAAEDDTVLARWPVPSQEAGWVTLEAPGDVPWRYRTLHALFLWSGRAAHAPALSLTDAAGMERFMLHRDDTPVPGRRLALRVWTGRPESGAPAGAAPPLSPPDAGEARLFAIPVARGALARHRPLVERALGGGWPWAVAREDEILVHPAPVDGPSAVAVSLNAARPVQGVRAVAASPNADAPRVAVRIAAYPAGHLEALDNDATDPLPEEGALALSPWQDVTPGSALPLALDFAPREGGVQLVLATRGYERRVGKAHIWFRDLRMICGL